jgi:hypothetical protein
VPSMLTVDEARSRGLAYLEGLGQSDKTIRMRKVFEAYMDGQATDGVMATTGCGRGTVSLYLNDIQAQFAAMRGACV